MDAIDGAALGLVDAIFLSRAGGLKGQRRQRDFADKDSRRWLDGARSAEALAAAGAACVTVVEDREGDIYECFAHRSAGVHKLVRAGQDRVLAEGGSLFARAASLTPAGRMTVDLPAIPGRKARVATLDIGFAGVALARPKGRGVKTDLPDAVQVNLVVAREIDALEGSEPAHWLLLTTHGVGDIADARRIVGFYRRRSWTVALRNMRPDERIYTFWDYRRMRWERDAGLRLDHLLLSPHLRARLVDAGVDREARGITDACDHAPLWIKLGRIERTSTVAGNGWCDATRAEFSQVPQFRETAPCGLRPPRSPSACR